MDKPDKHALREMRQTFNAADAAPANRLVPGSGKSLRVKVFKSGNSLALRLPKALGLEAGMELELNAAPGGGYTLNKVEPPRRKIDISGFAGKAPWLKPLPRELKEFEERPSTIAKRKAAGLE